MCFQDVKVICDESLVAEARRAYTLLEGQVSGALTCHFLRAYPAFSITPSQISKRNLSLVVGVTYCEAAIQAFPFWHWSMHTQKAQL